MSDMMPCRSLMRQTNKDVAHETSVNMCQTESTPSVPGFHFLLDLSRHQNTEPFVTLATQKACEMIQNAAVKPLKA